MAVRRVRIDYILPSDDEGDSCDDPESHQQDDHTGDISLSELKDSTPFSHVVAENIYYTAKEADREGATDLAKKGFSWLVTCAKLECHRAVAPMPSSPLGPHAADQSNGNSGVKRTREGSAAASPSPWSSPQKRKAVGVRRRQRCLLFGFKGAKQFFKLMWREYRSFGSSAAAGAVNDAFGELLDPFLWADVASAKKERALSSVIRMLHAEVTLLLSSAISTTHGEVAALSAAHDAHVDVEGNELREKAVGVTIPEQKKQRVLERVPTIKEMNPTAELGIQLLDVALHRFAGRRTELLVAQKVASLAVTTQDTERLCQVLDVVHRIENGSTLSKAAEWEAECTKAASKRPREEGHRVSGGRRSRTRDDDDEAGEVVESGSSAGGQEASGGADSSGMTGEEHSKLINRVSCDTLALEMQLCVATDAMHTLGSLVDIADKLDFRVRAVHPSTLGAIGQCRGYYFMYKMEWENARGALLDANACYANALLRREQIATLRYAILCSVLSDVKIDPLETVEAKQLEDAPEIQEFRRLMFLFREGRAREVAALIASSPTLVHDRVIVRCFDELLVQARRDAIKSYMKPYHRVFLTSLCEMLGMSEHHTEALLTQLVLDGQLSVLLDQRPGKPTVVVSVGICSATSENSGCDTVNTDRHCAINSIAKSLQSFMPFSRTRK